MKYGIRVPSFDARLALFGDVLRRIEACRGSFDVAQRAGIGVELPERRRRKKVGHRYVGRLAVLIGVVDDDRGVIGEVQPLLRPASGNRRVHPLPAAHVFVGRQEQARAGLRDAVERRSRARRVDERGVQPAGFAARGGEIERYQRSSRKRRSVDRPLLLDGEEQPPVNEPLRLGFERNVESARARCRHDIMSAM